MAVTLHNRVFFFSSTSPSGLLLVKQVVSQINCGINEIHIIRGIICILRLRTVSHSRDSQKKKRFSTLLQMSHQPPTQNVTALDEHWGILGDSLGQGESLTA